MLKWLIVIVLVVLIAAGGCWFSHRGKSELPQYTTAAVETGDLTQAVTATGTLNPVVNVTVGCQVSGRISGLYVDFNSTVTNGQLIAEIDTRTYQAALEQATADLANAQANLDLQRIEADRATKLYNEKLISDSDHDSALAQLRSATATVQIKTASLSNAMANLGYCKIYSPVDGVVISRAVDVGQTVAASLSAPTLFQIANDLTKMQIDSSVAEADVGGIEEGQNVDFGVDAYPYRTFHGVVTQVRNAPTTVNNVVTYDCVIGVTNSDYKLKPGMTANVSIIVAQRNGVLTIPNSALRFRPLDEDIADTTTAMTSTNSAESAQVGGGNRSGAGRQGGRRGGGFSQRGRTAERPVFHTVYIMPADAGKGAKPQPVQIRTGITDGISTEVLDGLKEGDQIVTGLNSSQTLNQMPGGNPFGGGGFPRGR